MDSQFWNDRYAADGELYGSAPNAFLEACTGLLPQTGRALVPGDGQGRNGVWLAQRGLETVAVDLSSVALDQAKARAKSVGVEIETRAGDFMAAQFERNSFSVVVSSWFHLPPDIRPAAHQRMADVLAPGGVLVLEAYSPGHARLREIHGSVGGPPSEGMMFTADMLRADFSALLALYIEELVRFVDEGAGHNGISRVARAVFVKA